MTFIRNKEGIRTTEEGENGLLNSARERGRSNNTLSPSFFHRSALMPVIKKFHSFNASD